MGFPLSVSLLTASKASSPSGFRPLLDVWRDFLFVEAVDPDAIFLLFGSGMDWTEDSECPRFGDSVGAAACRADPELEVLRI